jgi:hypothetical protein
MTKSIRIGIPGAPEPILRGSSLSGLSCVLMKDNGYGDAGLLFMLIVPFGPWTFCSWIAVLMNLPAASNGEFAPN